MLRDKVILCCVLLTVSSLVLTACAQQQELLETTINLNLFAEPPTLDPCLATDLPSYQVIDGLFLALTDIDDQTSEAIPQLATSWTVSDDGLVWTFQLRDDVWWVHYDPKAKRAQKKRQVTAHDVEYSITRTIDPATASDTAYIHSVITNVLAVDDHTVQFTLEHPAGYFPFIASFNYPLPREVLEQFGDEWTEPGNLWSCGPYVLDTWEHDSRLVQVKNPLYYDARSVSIETVKWAMINDAATALAMYETGELDHVKPPLADLDRIRADSELSKQLHIMPQLMTAYIGFNVTKPPVDDRLVRRALSAATDRQSLIDTVLKGGEKPAKTFAAPGIFGSPAEDPNFRGIRFDPQQAREWLSEAGYPDGKGFPEIIFMFAAQSEVRRFAEWVQKQWKDNLGIDVKLVSQEWKVYLQTVHMDPPHAYALGWIADYPDENNWVLEVFHPTKGHNTPQWSAKDQAARQFMKLTEAAAAEAEPAVRKDLYFEAERVLCEDEAIIIPLYHAVDVYLTKPYLDRIYPVMGGLHIEKWKVRAH